MTQKMAHHREGAPPLQGKSSVAAGRPASGANAGAKSSPKPAAAVAAASNATKGSKAAAPKAAPAPAVPGFELVDDVREGIPIAVSLLSWCMVALAVGMAAVSLLLAAAAWTFKTQNIELWGMTASGYVFRVQPVDEQRAERLLMAPAARQIVGASR